MLLYDESRHEYSDGWARIPSVTQVLSSYFGIDSRFYAPGAAERGTRAHELCAAYASGHRGRITDPYARAFAQWCFDEGARPLLIEQMIEGEISGRRYAGRLDLVVDLRGVRVLVDLKTGAKAKWHHAQVAAYSRVARPARAMLLYLRPDATYRPEVLSGSDLVAGLTMFADALAAFKET